MIRKIFFFVGTISAVIIFQILGTKFFSVGRISPDLFLVVTTFFALRLGPLTGECLGFTFGIVSDGIAISLFGSQTFALTLVGYSLGYLKGKIDEERPLAQVAMVLCVSLAVAAVLVTLESIFGGNTERYDLLTSVARSFYTSVSALIVFPVLILWNRFLD